MALSRRSRPSSINIWPGFVDALAQLLMVIIFILLVFTVGQFYLSGAVSDRDLEIKKLTQQLNQLTDMLSLEKRASDELRLNMATLGTQAQQASRDKDALATKLAQANADAQAQAQDLDRARDKLAAGDATIATLNANVVALRQQLDELAKALDLAQAQNKDQQVQIADLGSKLNLALAAKVEELAKYRSEFFGRLRQILGDRPDIRVVGDRFVFQSEVLFDPGMADFEAGARQKLEPVVSALKQIEAGIPPGINWILEVDGHTDPRPISTAQFKSNWELSTARAVSVVKFLIDQGIPAEHLAAAGFGEWQPLEKGSGEDAYRKNRRIELRLTQH
ncbi:MAG TPA: peptidoglycan -binding protein [Aliidongia sp.]|uniref:peptidoglycan -binding protein n=1 Tax=Aliidongia sp. TaxID=1914230 RepID=UPI002DDC97F5|nr:peptidoglycan -binding protein [Aliidongia sp.]HEV2676601.1 peptidoglycan -binding protein [Aliidongia sp.]